MNKKLSAKQQEALAYLKSNPHGITYTMWGNSVFSASCPKELTVKTFKSLVDRGLAEYKNPFGFDRQIVLKKDK